MNPEIRITVTADIPHLCRLLNQLFSIENDFSPDEARQAAGLEALLARQASDQAQLLLAVTDGMVVGMGSPCDMAMPFSQVAPASSLTGS